MTTSTAMTTSLAIAHEVAASATATPLAPSAGRCLVRTLVVFTTVDLVFTVLLSAGYAQTSSLPAWRALWLGVTVSLPLVIVANALLALLARAIYRRLQSPGDDEASILRAAMMLRRFPQRVVALEVVRWVGAFALVAVFERPPHWQPMAFFLITMGAGPLALSFPLTDWCNASATAELWRSMHARGIAMPVRPTRLAVRLSLYSVALVFTAGSYFASFAFAARLGLLDLDTMLISIAIFSSSALSFALLAAFVFSTTFTRPILEMSEVVSRISSAEGVEGAAQIERVPLRQGDEIGMLARLTNTMIGRLETTAAERAGALHALEQLNQTLERRVEDRTQELTKVQAVAVASAHRAGMAEISANVLHNVGNVLNSVNVSCDQLEVALRSSRAPALSKATQLLCTHAGALGDFLTSDARGKVLPEYLIKAGAAIGDEHAQLLAELGRLKSKVHLINTVISAQQQYASGRFLTERANVTEVVDDILEMQAHALRRGQVRVVRQVAPVDEVPIQRTKLAHILVNLMKNAEEAMARTPVDDRVLTIEVGGGARPFIHVRDVGEGICPENLAKIFQHGFTTKPDGHGFGLHSCVSSMAEMGGQLTVTSDGVGHGATFTLQFAGA